LTLRRLRQAHPQPRYTIASAEEKLASQVAEMQQAEVDLQQVGQRVTDMKGSVRATVKELDRLRMERAELEKQLGSQSHNIEDDSEDIELHEW